eukprot:2558930-Pyramimonas_sp.AAC.1
MGVRAHEWSKRAACRLPAGMSEHLASSEVFLAPARGHPFSNVAETKLFLRADVGGASKAAPLFGPSARLVSSR